MLGHDEPTKTDQRQDATLIQLSQQVAALMAEIEDLKARVKIIEKQVG